MSWKETTVIGITVIGLAIGANEVLSPDSLQDISKQQQQQQMEDLSDSQEKQTEKWRDDLPDGTNVENERKLQPSEQRTGKKPSVRLRLP